jgi:ABC-type uncharacterized transport system involved in gliding motility auxiliary subunit
VDGDTPQSERFYTRSSVKFVTVVGVLLILNYLSLQHNFEFDFTETGEFSLSEETLHVLENLSESVHIVGFFKKGDYRWVKAAKYLDRYAHNSNLLTYALYDPNIELTLAKNYKVKSYGLIFINGSHRYTVRHIDEESITTGVMCVTSNLHNDENARLISIDEKESINRDIFLTPFQIILTFVVSVIVIPTLVLFGGIRAWRVRH